MAELGPRDVAILAVKHLCLCELLDARRDSSANRVLRPAKERHNVHDGLVALFHALAWTPSCVVLSFDHLVGRRSFFLKTPELFLIFL